MYVRTYARDEQTTRVFTVFRELFTVHCFENPAATDVLASRSVADSERASERGEGGGGGRTVRGSNSRLSSRDTFLFSRSALFYLAIRVTSYGEKNTISVKNATSIRKDAGLPRSS